jgi:hypothetical protein
MKKLAQKPASFNEQVPSTAVGMEASDSQGQAQPQKSAKVDPASDQYAAIPIEEGQEQEQQPQGSTVPQEMVDAAHSFLGPEVLQAALQGDPNAADLVARTAAHFGSTFMNMANSAQAAVAPGAENMEQGAVSGQQAPMGITTPEEDLAAELVPNVPTPQQATPGAQGATMPQDQQASQVSGQQSSMEASSGKDVAQEQSQPPVNEQGIDQNGNPQMVDIATVAKLINLVKAGKI